MDQIYVKTYSHTPKIKAIPFCLFSQQREKRPMEFQGFTLKNITDTQVTLNSRPFQVFTPMVTGTTKVMTKWIPPPHPPSPPWGLQITNRQPPHALSSNLPRTDPSHCKIYTSSTAPYYILNQDQATHFLRYVISTFMPSLNRLMCMACLWTGEKKKAQIDFIHISTVTVCHQWQTVCNQ